MNPLPLLVSSLVLLVLRASFVFPSLLSLLHSTFLSSISSCQPWYGRTVSCRVPVACSKLLMPANLHFFTLLRIEKSF